MITGLSFWAIFTSGVLSGIAALYGYRALVSRWVKDEPEPPVQTGTWYPNRWMDGYAPGKRRRDGGYPSGDRTVSEVVGGYISSGRNVSELRPPSGPKGAA